MTSKELRVTEVLQAAGLRDGMRFMSDEDREWYFARGRANHKATELLDLGTLDFDSLDDRIKPYIEGYGKFKQDYQPTVLSIEEEVRGRGFVGHLDRVYRVGASKWLVDIKTNGCDAATAVQTAAYLDAKGWKAHRYGLALHDNGTYKLTRYDNDALDLACWQAALRVAQWKLRNGIKIKESEEE